EYQHPRLGGVASPRALGHRGAVPGRALAGREPREGVAWALREARGARKVGRVGRAPGEGEGEAAGAPEEPRPEGADDRVEEAPRLHQGRARPPAGRLRGEGPGGPRGPSVHLQLRDGPAPAPGGGDIPNDEVAPVRAR